MDEINVSDVLDNVKTHFDIQDTMQDDLIALLIQRVLQNFKRTYNQLLVPQTFQDIIEDCTIRRYVRRGDEGAKHVYTEGHRRDFFEPAEEFEEWDASIRKTIALLQDDPNLNGDTVVRFL